MRVRVYLEGLLGLEGKRAQDGVAGVHPAQRHVHFNFGVHLPQKIVISCVKPSKRHFISIFVSICRRKTLNCVHPAQRHAHFYFGVHLQGEKNQLREPNNASFYFDSRVDLQPKNIQLRQPLKTSCPSQFWCRTVRHQNIFIRFN